MSSLCSAWLKLAATSAGARGQGQGEPEASEEQNTERLTIHSGGHVATSEGLSQHRSFLPDVLIQKLGLQAP